jgi:hypothetical protein
VFRIYNLRIEEASFGKLFLQEVRVDEKALNDERVLMESLVNTRFNYLLVVFTVVVTGLTTSKSALQFALIALAGVVITAALGWTIVRAQLKQSLLFDQIKKDPGHPATFADVNSRRIEPNHWMDLRRYSAQKVIGYGFPTAIPLVFVLAFLFRHQLYAGNKMEDRAQRLEENTQILSGQLARDEGEIQSLHKSIDILGTQLLALDSDIKTAQQRPSAAPKPAPKPPHKAIRRRRF